MNCRQRIKSLKMVVKTSDKKQFSYIYVRNLFLELTQPDPLFDGLYTQCSAMDFALNLIILRFLVFKIWSILYSTFVVHWGLRRIQKNCISLTRNFLELTVNREIISLLIYYFYICMYKYISININNIPPRVFSFIIIY